MEIAEGGDGFLAGAEHEVISICQNNLRTGGGDVVGEDSFDGALCADGHEGWGVELAVGCGDTAGPCATDWITMKELILERSGWHLNPNSKYATDLHR